MSTSNGSNPYKSLVELANAKATAEVKTLLLGIQHLPIDEQVEIVKNFIIGKMANVVKLLLISRTNDG